MGFIGPNGAGKTTTLKCMLGLTPKDGGSVQLFGQDFFQNELAFKQHIGVSFGGVDFYAKTRIRTITDVVRRFYDNWDDSAYRSYMARFHLDEAKRPSELSGGMKIKYALALAMSHHAKLLILDEPTSGLDPVARDDLLTLFQELIETGDVSILFSTHITSDLEKCADFITYIENGRMIASCEKDELIASYLIVKENGGAAADIERVWSPQKRTPTVHRADSDERPDRPRRRYGRGTFAGRHHDLSRKRGAPNEKSLNKEFRLVISPLYFWSRCSARWCSSPQWVFFIAPMYLLFDALPNIIQFSKRRKTWSSPCCCPSAKATRFGQNTGLRAAADGAGARCRHLCP
jgi:ABC-2 type transport system ATP-binding protein